MNAIGQKVLGGRLGRFSSRQGGNTSSPAHFFAERSSAGSPCRATAPDKRQLVPTMRLVPAMRQLVPTMRLVPAMRQLVPTLRQSPSLPFPGGGLFDGFFRRCELFEGIFERFPFCVRKGVSPGDLHGMANRINWVAWRDSCGWNTPGRFVT